MNFYNDLSAYYDKLFPPDNDTVSFLEKRLPFGGTVMDIACGTGTYSVCLARKGFRITGIDADRDMVSIARDSLDRMDPSVRGMVRFLHGDMEELQAVTEKPFQASFCIGNSLVHLPSIERIGSFLHVAAGILDPGGKFIIQIINFDRILDDGVSELPALEANDVRMERMYDFPPEGGHVFFKTKLYISGTFGSERTVENSIPLVPLRSEQLMSLLEDAGFRVTDLFGSFSGSPYNHGSFLTIACAEKGT